MRRALTLMAVLLAILTGLTGSLATISSISAQTTQDDDATPAADESGAVTIYGANGEPAGEITIDAIVDPFEDFDPSFSPQRGFHYVMAGVTVTAGDAALEASAYSFSLVDADGFAYTTTFAYRSTEDTEAMPDFAGGTIEAGDSLSGVIFFEVLDGTTAAYLTYQPTYETLLTVADLREEPVEQGDTVDYISSSSQPLATFTVEEVVSPLKDYDPSYAPERGFEYAGVVVTVENTGDAPLQVDPYSFYLVDAQSFIFNNASTVRTEEAEADVPTLQSAELPAGESVTGLISFQVLAGTEIGMIYYSPASDRQLRLAEYGEGQAPTPSDSSDDIPTNSNVGTDNSDDTDLDETPEPEETPVPQASDEECEPVLEWGEATIVQFEALNLAYDAIAPALSGEDLDADALRDAADALEDAAAEQEDIDTPELAEDANDALIAVFDEAVTTLNDLADAVEAGDDDAIDAAVEAFLNIGTEEGPGSVNQTFDDLSEACPALENIGDDAEE